MDILTTVMRIFCCSVIVCFLFWEFPMMVRWFIETVKELNV